MTVTSPAGLTEGVALFAVIWPDWNQLMFEISGTGRGCGECRYSARYQLLHAAIGVHTVRARLISDPTAPDHLQVQGCPRVGSRGEGAHNSALMEPAMKGDERWERYP